MGEGLRVAVTGAGGFVARHLRRHLSGSGAALVSISRGKIEELAGETAVASAGYSEDILPAITGCDALVHLVGSGRQSPGASYEEVNAQTARRVAELSRRAGIGKLVYLSGLGVSENPATEYFASKLRAEGWIRRTGVDYTIFRPSYIVGPDDPLTLHLAGSARGGEIRIPGSGRYLVRPIRVDDAARIIAESLARPGFSGATVDLVGPDIMTFAEYVGAFAAGTGARISHVDIEEAYRAALADPAAEYGVDDLNILLGSFTGDYGRLAALASRPPRPVLEPGGAP